VSEFRLQVRIPVELHKELERAALADGCNVSEFVRRAVADRISKRSVRQLGQAIADEVAPRIAREIELLMEVREKPEEFSAPTTVIFDRSCIDAELHRPGTLCGSCGGSAYTTR